MTATAVYVIAPVTSGIHLTTVPHHFCSEHGALEHDGCEGHHCHSADQEFSEARQEKRVDGNSNSARFPHRHQACHNVQLSQRQVLEEDAPNTSRSVTPAIERVHPRVRLAHSQRALSVAPKNSPPA